MKTLPELTMRPKPVEWQVSIEVVGDGVRIHMHCGSPGCRANLHAYDTADMARRNLAQMMDMMLAHYEQEHGISL